MTPHIMESSQEIRLQEMVEIPPILVLHGVGMDVKIDVIYVIDIRPRTEPPMPCDIKPNGMASI